MRRNNIIVAVSVRMTPEHHDFCKKEGIQISSILRERIEELEEFFKKSGEKTKNLKMVKLGRVGAYGSGRKITTCVNLEKSQVEFLKKYGLSQSVILQHKLDEILEKSDK